MSRTIHHRSQKHHPHHNGFDYGGRYKHNKHWGGGYGAFGRKMAARERRNKSKRPIRQELLML